jgi:hypothetical protein
MLGRNSSRSRQVAPQHQRNSSVQTPAIEIDDLSLPLENREDIAPTRTFSTNRILGCRANVTKLLEELERKQHLVLGPASVLQTLHGERNGTEVSIHLGKDVSL